MVCIFMVEKIILNDFIHKFHRAKDFDSYLSGNQLKELSSFFVKTWWNTPQIWRHGKIINFLLKVQAWKYHMSTH